VHERLTQQNSAPKRHHRRAHCDLHWQEGTPEVRARIKTLAEMRASIIDSLLTKATTARYGAALSKTTAAELEDLPAHELGSSTMRSADRCSSESSVVCGSWVIERRQLIGFSVTTHPTT